MPAPVPTGSLYLYCDNENNQIGYLLLDGSGNPLVVTGYSPSNGDHNFFAKYMGDANYPGPFTSPLVPYTIDSNNPQITFSITFNLQSPQPQGTALNITVGVTGSE